MMKVHLPYPHATCAVVRLIAPGTLSLCPNCDEPVKFEAKKKLRQVICNIYEGDKWDRVEQYHTECYVSAGAPYGEPLQ